MTTYKKLLKSIDIDKIGSETGKLDYLVLDNKIDADLFIYNELKSHLHNPLFYTDPAFIFDYLLKQYAPLDQRIPLVLL